MMVGVLLAAGASRRMGSSKALRRAGRHSFIAHGIRHLWNGCDSVVVVLGAEAVRIRKATEEEFERLVKARRLHPELAHAHRHGAAELEAQFVVNRAWKRGMFSSVCVGLREAMALAPEGVLVLPVDHPAVSTRTLSSLIRLLREALAAFGKDRGRRARFAYALIPRYRRRRGHPIALSPALAAAIAADGDAESLSDAVRRNAGLVGYLDCADPGVVRNRNTPRD